jgi:hypothetical protein
MNYVEELNAEDENFEKSSVQLGRKNDAWWSIFINEEKQLFEEIDLDQYDLIYFDAFGYRVQPELWTPHF